MATCLGNTTALFFLLVFKSETLALKSLQTNFKISSGVISFFTAITSLRTSFVKSRVISLP